MKLYEYSILCRTAIVVAADGESEARAELESFSASTLFEIGSEYGLGNSELIEVDLMDEREVPEPYIGQDQKIKIDLAHVVVLSPRGVIIDRIAFLEKEIERLKIRCGESCPEGETILDNSLINSGSICPYCGYEDSDYWDNDYAPGQDPSDEIAWQRVRCPECDREYEAAGVGLSFIRARKLA